MMLLRIRVEGPDVNKEVDFGTEDEVEVVLSSRMSDVDDYLAKNSLRIIYQTNNFFLPQIRDMIEKKEAINLRPEYQRRLRWTNAQKSKLIESLLLNIPVPPVFFYESDAARYEVMDGQQRLNAIRDYFAGDFALIGLQVLIPLNGMRYNRCPPRVKRTLDRATVSAIVLLMESKPEIQSSDSLKVTDIRRLVFDRLNTGGRKLNAQEIRNALNPGAMNRIVIELSRHSSFTEVFGIPAYSEANEEDFYENPLRQKNALYSSMRDCELILRFFALREDGNIRGSMKSILDRAMAVEMISAQEMDAKSDFISRFEFLRDLFDGSPFKIEVDGKEKISAALYDAAMVAIDRLWQSRESIRFDKEDVKIRLDSALLDPDEYEIIIGRGNTAEAVRSRIKLLESIFKPE